MPRKDRKPTHEPGTWLEVVYEDEVCVCVYGHVKRLIDCEPEAINHFKDVPAGWWNEEGFLKQIIHAILHHGVMYVHWWGKKRPPTPAEQEDYGFGWMLEERRKKPEKGFGWFTFTKIYQLEATEQSALNHPKHADGTLADERRGDRTSLLRELWHPLHQG